MGEVHNITCTVCPFGCQGEVETDGGSVKKISGFTCPRGADYAAAEVTDPRRMLTTTVRVSKGDRPLVPVASRRPLPKHLIRDCMKVLAGVAVAAPVAEGQVICPDILRTGIDIVATGGAPAAQ